MNFEEKLKSGKFIITAEVSPPRGVDVSSFVSKTLMLKDRVDAVNVTDFQNVGVRITSLVGSYLLLKEGIEPIFQITARDRNRVAISGELLSAYTLGIKNVLVLTGDYTTTGISKSAKPVFDLDAVNILKIAKMLESGEDFAGKKLNKSPNFFLGAVFNPNLTPLDIEILKMKKKILAGAEFFQTQLVFDLSIMERVREKVGSGVKIIVGVTIFKSLEMIDYMINNVPGIKIPRYILEKFERKDNIKNIGIELCVDLCSKIKESKLVNGVHFLASKPSDIIEVMNILRW
uniref:Methylenetetrahydrofolate reductase n=1 Tax=Dictyoglomus thermophilum TaxID=14 RepID=A0A7C3RI06_DICTH